MESLGERLIGLLLREIPIEEYEQAINEALSETRGEADFASIRRQVDDAVQLRTLLDRYRHRAAELAALYDSANDLSSLRDVENVLQAIVRRGRQLLRTDVAYLMLIDEERGDTYMRVTEGTVTPDFINVRLALGVGLGGLVAQTAAPHWTSKYLDDQRYLHAIDDIVKEERLLAILGVPLKIGRRVIGVLFVADRHPRTFATEEVSLLSSLAAHAAIALENASLFQSTQSALTRLTDAMEVIKRQNDALQRASSVHERLTGLVVAGGTDCDIAEMVVDVLGGALLMFDPDGRLVARAAAPAYRGPDLDDAAILGRVQAMATGSRRPARSRIEGRMCHVAPVIAGTDHLGSLVFVGPELGDADTRTLERAATVTALLRLNQRAHDEAENRVRGELFAELLAGPVHDAVAVQRRAALAGIDLTCAMTVAVAVPGAGGVAGPLKADAIALARAAHGLVMAHGDRIVLLLPGSEAGAVARSIAQRLHASGDGQVTVGAVGPLPDLSQVPEAERQARRCAQALRHLAREGDGATPDELGLYGLLLSEAADDQVEAFIRATLGRIETHDIERGTTLLDSIERYFEHDGNVARAAQDLFVHANTLYQRLDRVDRIIGPQWRKGDRALEVRLALRLRRLRRSLEPHGPLRRDAYGVRPDVWRRPQLSA
jgi:sugar diacid utilization regulator/GAF domain-containing protein